MAMAQPKAWRRHSALVLLALGMGAGLRAGEITLATTADVVGRTGSLCVSVGVDVPRTVRVQPDYAAPLAALAKRSRAAPFCSIARRSIATTQLRQRLLPSTGARSGRTQALGQSVPIEFYL